MVLKNYQNKKLLAFIIFTLFWLLLGTLTGTITSGYHLTDDHEIVNINKNIHDLGFFESTKSVIINDLSIRFRPFYYFHRATLIKLFSTNFIFYSIYNTFLAIFTSYFLFIYIFRQGYKFTHSLIFPFLTLIGSQSAIWWRLGPAETIGFLLLSISIVFLVNSVFRKKNYLLIISVTLMFFATLSKESFIIFIPAYITLLFLFERQCDPKSSFSILIQKNIFIILILVLIFLIEIFIIAYFIGTNKIGYAGIDCSFSIYKFIKSVYLFLRQNKYLYLVLFGLFLLFQNMKFGQPLTIIKETLIRLPYSAVVLFAIIIPQLILYNKNLISERYLLPLNLGFSLYIMYLLKKIFEHKQITLFSKRAYLILIILVILSFFKNETLPYAKSYTNEGKSTNDFISSIAKHTQINDSILIVLNGYENYEWGYSLYSYLRNNANRKNIFFYPIKTHFVDEFAKVLERKFLETNSNLIATEINKSFSCIAILPFSINKEIKQFIGNQYSYPKNQFDSFSVYYRPNPFIRREKL